MRLTRIGANRYKKGSWGATVERPEDLVEEVGFDHQAFRQREALQRECGKLEVGRGDAHCSSGPSMRDSEGLLCDEEGRSPEMTAQI